MTYIELKKQNLIERLNAISDESLLDDIEQLLNERETVLHFSPELKGNIDKALEQMRNGEIYSEEEMDKFFDKWLATDEA